MISGITVRSLFQTINCRQVVRQWKLPGFKRVKRFDFGFMGQFFLCFSSACAGCEGCFTSSSVSFGIVSEAASSDNRVTFSFKLMQLCFSFLNLIRLLNLQFLKGSDICVELINSGVALVCRQLSCAAHRFQLIDVLLFFLCSLLGLCLF